MADDLRWTAGTAELTVRPADGGRMTSLVVAGHELLVTGDPDPIRWGSYPMAPFAGRIREGRFAFEGRDVELPRNLPPHAIHGTVFERGWAVIAPDTIAIDLGPAWPFAGRVTQRFSLRPDGLEVELTLAADEPMPGVIGWHPWFRRVLTGTAAAPRPASAPVELAIDPEWMYERGADGLPTGQVVAPGPPPWDDCFTGLPSDPRLRWPGVLDLEIAADADHWVVFTEPPAAICVEPQTGPPDAVHIRPTVVVPEIPLRATMTWRWSVR